MVQKTKRYAASAKNKKSASPQTPNILGIAVILLLVFLAGVGVLTSKKAPTPTSPAFILTAEEMARIEAYVKYAAENPISETIEEDGAEKKRWREFRRYYSPTPEEEAEIVREYDFDEDFLPWVREIYEGYRGTLSPSSVRILVFQDMVWHRCFNGDCSGIERVLRLMDRLGMSQSFICQILDDIYDDECCEYVVDDLLDEFCLDGSEDDDPETVY